MKLRGTLVLILAAIAASVVVYINPFSEDETREPREPWFYQVAQDDIEVIEITLKGSSLKFEKTDEDTWVFVDPLGIPPIHQRWAGITLLLSGPQTRRDITIAAQTIDDPAQYGLDDPQMIVDVGLTADRQLQFRLGDKTTNRNHSYGQVIGFPQLYLVAGIWGDVLARLVREPPIPKWWVERAPEDIIEVNVYLGDFEAADTEVRQFKQEDGVWFVRDFIDTSDLKPLDVDRWAEYIPLMTGPPPISVAVHRVDDQDYTQWGITEDSNHIEVRFAGLSPEGVEWNDGVLFRLGSKTPDGSAYYALSFTKLIVRPVLLLDAEWTETLMGLFDNTPYGPVLKPDS